MSASDVNEPLIYTKCTFPILPRYRCKRLHDYDYDYRDLAQEVLSQPLNPCAFILEQTPSSQPAESDRFSYCLHIRKAGGDSPETQLYAESRNTEPEMVKDTPMTDPEAISHAPSSPTNRGPVSRVTRLQQKRMAVEAQSEEEDPESDQEPTPKPIGLQETVY